MSSPPSINPPGRRPTTGTRPASLEANRRDGAHGRARRTARAVAIVATGAAAALGLVVSKEIPGASASAQATVSSTSSGTGGTTATPSSTTSSATQNTTPSSATQSTTPSSTTKSATVVSGGTGS
ncbi:MAG TPA: hypothetical protein VII76_03200 [Acidimicrobiales bacterium]